jgi:hypothetical protein
MYVNGKMRPVVSIPGMGVGGIKEKNGRGEFNDYVFDTLPQCTPSITIKKKNKKNTSKLTI